MRAIGFSAAVAFGKAVLSSVMGKNSKLPRSEESLRWLSIIYFTSRPKNYQNLRLKTDFKPIR